MQYEECVLWHLWRLLTVILFNNLSIKISAILEENPGIETHYYCRQEIPACFIVEFVMELFLFT